MPNVSAGAPKDIASGRLRIKTLLLALALGVAALPVQAEERPRPLQARCADYALLAEALRTQYGEVPVTIGLQNDGNLMTTFASERARTWTILSVTPRGRACIISAGRSFEQMPLAPDEPPA